MDIQFDFKVRTNIMDQYENKHVWHRCWNSWFIHLYCTARSNSYLTPYFAAIAFNECCVCIPISI